eukprot:351644-Chlamydomonas_euryale.AAC.6
MKPPRPASLALPFSRSGCLPGANQALVLPSKKQAREQRLAERGGNGADSQPQRVLSRSEQRKLKQVSAWQAAPGGQVGELG